MNMADDASAIRRKAAETAAAMSLSSRSNVEELVRLLNLLAPEFAAAARKLGLAYTTNGYFKRGWRTRALESGGQHVFLVIYKDGRWSFTNGVHKSRGPAEWPTRPTESSIREFLTAQLVWQPSR
ncbi:hypothetical protein [Gordonia sp. NPDC058843]|uniref:hypothetical protein n=1 Tax=Gordonia sp. NPDC058843 TaxID=3346648 RepID=UPI003679E746